MTRSKRLFDLSWSMLGLAVLWPLFALVAVLVKLEDGGPVFFRQRRVGFKGREFRVWKFRTMVPEAPERGPAVTVGGDPRITRVGRMLRRLKIDELPQLFNVLAGEMSLVGPRPEVPEYARFYAAEQRRVLDLVPGLTDAASLRFRDEGTLLTGRADPGQTKITEILPTKIRLSLRYAAHATRWTDFVVILASLGAVGAPSRLTALRVAAWLLFALCAPCATSLPAQNGFPASLPPAVQVLKPGDMLRVTVWRAPEFSGEFFVGPDSSLIHPLYQGIKIGGLRLDAVKGRLTQFLSEYQRDPRIVLEPLVPVVLAGEVRTPNLYFFSEGSSLAYAFARAGGLTDRADLSNVRVVRNHKAFTLDLRRDPS